MLKLAPSTDPYKSKRSGTRQAFILKVDSRSAGARAQFFADPTVWRAVLPGNVRKKGVRRLTGYFMGYYTIWLDIVKGIFVPSSEFRNRKVRRHCGAELDLKAESCGADAQGKPKADSSPHKCGGVRNDNMPGVGIG